MPKTPMSKDEINNTREKILDTALAVIIDEGFNNLSVRKIASRMGITATTIYNYYANKDELNLKIRKYGFEKLYNLMKKRSESHSELKDKIKGINVGADDYLTKPFDPMELEARVQIMLQSNEELHFLTKFMGRKPMINIIKNKLKKDEDFVLMLFNIRNFKHLNKNLGFKRGNDVLRLVSNLLTQSTEGDESVLGHMSADRFVVLAKKDNFSKFRYF